MRRLGPYESHPALMVAVSGGADSMALALLAQNWVRPLQGTLRALVVDHGLRAGSAEEAQTVINRLSQAGIASTLLTLETVRPGTALAERARIARYEALGAGCRAVGVLHLLLGHHAMDQAETMMMRVLRQTLTHGLAAMPALFETPSVRLLRPLLNIEPQALRTFLRDRGLDWVEDPSNRDVRALRPRLRHRLAPHPQANGVATLTEAARSVGLLRAREEAATAAELAQRVTLRPEGFALLSPGRISPAALSGLLRTIGGAAYAPSVARLADLAAQPQPATIAGVRLLSAARFGEGFIVVREEAAMAEPVEASKKVTWDGRFRLVARIPLPAGLTVGKLGADAVLFREQSTLPSVVLRTLPALRFEKRLAAVPHLGYSTGKPYSLVNLLFAPPGPIAGACFLPA